METRKPKKYGGFEKTKKSSTLLTKKNKFMESQKVDMFIMTNSKYFESHQVALIRDKMIALDESKWPMVSSLQFKDPTTILIVSILAGSLGIDRFMIGDTGLGIGKLITCGGLGIWAIIDWFMIQSATREKNMLKLQQLLD
jgi:TM2 domain-containing membrane protein YozV